MYAEHAERILDSFFSAPTQLETLFSEGGGGGNFFFPKKKALTPHGKYAEVGALVTIQNSLLGVGSGWKISLIFGVVGIQILPKHEKLKSKRLCPSDDFLIVTQYDAV